MRCRTVAHVLTNSFANNLGPSLEHPRHYGGVCVLLDVNSFSVKVSGRVEILEYSP